MTKKPFSGNLADLVPSADRSERARLETETRAKVDGRKLRRNPRTIQMVFRVKPECRAQIERLALHFDCDFVDVLEKAIDALEDTIKKP